MTALVTGANGFLGSAVARALLADGAEVRAFVRRGSDRRNLAGVDVEVDAEEGLVAVGIREGEALHVEDGRAHARSMSGRCPS